MALKDWKKNPVIENSWYRKNDSLEIIENSDQNSNTTFYSIEIFLWETKDETAKWLNSRHFRTKQMAIKQAKEYMRTH
jgi:hypothetical protein